MVGERPDATAIESREPSVEDLAQLCEWLNAEGARYMILGGFAMRAAGYDRRTMDIDILVEATPDNEARVIAAVSRLADGAARELVPGDITASVVVRVADEIVVDLMQSASGYDYGSASSQLVWRSLGGVSVPFASPELLLKMKSESVREKDRADAAFLRRLLGSGGEVG